MTIQKMLTSALLCGSVLSLSLSVASAETINAAGATFPAPLYQKWFNDFKKIHPDFQVNYQALGSGAGIRQLTEGTVDFGATDKPMSDEEMAKITKFHVLHFPTVLGGVVPTYNIEGVTESLKFTPETLSGIFLGTIKNWNDPALKKDNANIKFPDKPITVAHRSDGSGTTFVFTDYLSKVSPDWKSKVGAGTAVNWPLGLGGKGNEGVAGLVKQTPNSIGYVELLYAIQNKMGYGSVKNSAGTFVKAELTTVTEAAEGAAKDMPDDFRVSITNAPGKNAYPISTFTWLLIPDKIENPAKKKAITDFLKWMLTTGQKYAAPLSYAPLPAPVVKKEEKQIAKIQ
jgi:phosphate transport system substrate-binding protein